MKPLFRPGEPPAPNLNGAAYCIGRAAAADGTKTALLVIGDGKGMVLERWTFAEIESAVLRIATGLRERGLAAGDRVMLRLGNHSDFPLLFFGVMAAGGVAVPTAAELTGRECDELVATARPAFILHDGTTSLPGESGTARLLGPADIVALKSATEGDYAVTRAEDPAFMVFTSGTGGRPKGVVHAHRALPGRAPMYQGWYGLSETDTLLHAGAFNWTYTLGAGLMDPWANRATSVVYAGRREPEVWPGVLVRSGATLFAAVPGLYRRILKYGDLCADPFPDLRHGLVAGEALAPGLLAEWVERTGVPLYEALGMSEISTYVSNGPNVPVRPGSPGKAQPGRRIAILAETGKPDVLPAGMTGALCVHRSDPGLMLGYWDDAAATRQAFWGEWFVTGDRARIDADGYLWHEGRADDVMNAFGYRVAPQEIERVLGEHPAVSEVAVTDVEGPEGISLITAFVVPSPDGRPTEAGLSAWCGARLARYKQPRAFVLMDQLPRTPSGKVLRRALSRR